MSTSSTQSQSQDAGAQPGTLATRQRRSRTGPAQHDIRWFFAFFFVSGFCALVYQVVWLRLTMAQFGVTTPVVSLVLAVFMAGLGLGCWGIGRLSHLAQGRSAAVPLRVYAVTEALIGLSAVAVPLQLAWGHGLLLSIVGDRSMSVTMHYGFSAFWIAVTLLPWCACMGATVPIAMSAIEKGFGGSRRSFSYLYLANVLGAVAGILVPAFLLIEIFGFRGTLYAAAALNFALAGAALALGGTFRRAQARGAPAGPAEGRGIRDLSPADRKLGLLWLLFATGLISLAMEVVWIRQFTPYLGTVIYAFATILAAYLVATYLGSRAYRRWIRGGDPESTGLLWMSLAFLGLLPLVTADPRLPFPTGVHVWSFLRVGIGVGAFSAAVGFLTPMLVDRWSGGDPHRAGDAYAVNVLGSVIGPLLAGFVLLPAVSERTALVLLSLPLLVIALIVVLRPAALGLARRPRYVGGRELLSLVAASVAVVTLSENFEDSVEVGALRRDATAVVIATGEGFGKRLLVNGVGMTELTPETKMMTHLPLAFLPRPPRDGIIVAFGMGTSFRSLHAWGVQASAVELVPSVVELFDYYHQDAEMLLASPRSRIVIDDGRRLLERSVDEYDVVVVDPPPPIGAAGSSLLYSKDFYDIVKRRLRPGGILQQWLSDGGDHEARASVARALVESFPHVRAFGSFRGQGLHFLASMEPIPDASPEALAARTPPEAVADLVEWGPHDTAVHQFAVTLNAEVSVEELIEAAPHMPALTDDRAVNEYYWFRHRLRDFGLR